MLRYCLYCVKTQMVNDVHFVKFARGMVFPSQHQVTTTNVTDGHLMLAATTLLAPPDFRLEADL